MKKLILLAAIAVLALGLVSCSSASDDITESSSTAEATSTAAQTSPPVTAAATAAQTEKAAEPDREPLYGEFFAEVIPPKYSWVQDFSEGLAGVYLDGKFGYIDKTGKEIIPLIYTTGTPFSEEAAWVSLCTAYPQKYGLIDKQGNQILPFEYYLSSSWSYYSRFSDGLALVATDDQYNSYVFIDKTGKRVTDAYEFVFPFSEGFAAVDIGTSTESMARAYAFINKAGKQITPATDPIVYMVFQDDGLRLHFSDGLAPFKKDGRYGFIDKTGKTVISFIYDYVQGFSEGLSLFYRDGKSGYVDKTGKEVLVFEKDERVSRGAFSNGLASVFKWGEFTNESYIITDNAHKVGYIDKNGKTVIPHTYDAIKGHGFTANEFREGVAAQRLDEKWGFIDTTGKVIVPFEYSEAQNISEGMAAVSIGGWSESGVTPQKWGFIQIK
jgi:hypothetical protein